MEISWLLSIYGYRRYPVIPNPLETFIIKNRQPIGIVTKRNRGENGGVNKWEKISWKNTYKIELKLKVQNRTKTYISAYVISS